MYLHVSDLLHVFFPSHQAPPARLAFENAFRDAMAPYATAQHQAAVAAGGGVGGSGSSNGAVFGEEASAAARVLEYVCAHGHLPIDDEDGEAGELFDGDGGVEAGGKDLVDTASSSGRSNWASTCSKKAPLATVKSHDSLVIVCVSMYPARLL